MYKFFKKSKTDVLAEELKRVNDRIDKLIDKSKFDFFGYEIENTRKQINIENLKRNELLNELKKIKS
jgi:hypothetical protein